MRYVRFLDQSGVEQQGVVEGHVVKGTMGNIFEEIQYSGEVWPLHDLKLLPPVIPANFYAAGVNYSRHLESVAKKKGVPFELPKQSHIGYRSPSALTGNETPIVVPRASCGRLQFEAELVAVIGKSARNVSEADALDYVFGYTIGNDVSERQWQAADRTLWRAKNCDTFKPMGPWIETNVSLENLTTVVRMNGDEVSRFRTNDMIFGVAATIAEISRFITLCPGDVIWMGTDEPTLDMVAGDVIEIEIDGIGILSNTLIAEGD